ncbi:MAG: ethanolamine ammonia-lyase subunit EutB [Blastocatellia bacterium]
MNRRELLQLFALASAFKEGDLLIGGTQDDRLRLEARQKLANTRLGDIAKTVFVEDGLSELLARFADKNLSREIASLSVGAARRMLLAGGSAEMWWQRYRHCLSSEMIAAIIKLMSNDELTVINRTFFNPLPGDDAVKIGSAQHLGACIQANSPGEDEDEVLFSILEGLSYGCGDVVLAVTPAYNDAASVTPLARLLAQIVERLNLPARFCVMTGISTQAAIRSQAKLDVAFQSLAGTSKALMAMAELDAAELMELAPSFDGLCFETGQGSELVDDAAEGVDMGTLESRAFGFARCLQKRMEQQASARWIVVNSLVGLNSQQAFCSAEQILRASLESVASAKLHGLTIGLDVCASFQSGFEPAALRQLTAQIAEQASPAFLNSIAGNADLLLGHLTTSFREHPALRRSTGKQITSAMNRRLKELGVINGSGLPSATSLTTAKLYSQFTQAGGDTRSEETLQAEGLKKLERLKRQGFDLGYGHLADFASPKEVERRMEVIYAQARNGMYAQ